MEFEVGVASIRILARGSAIGARYEVRGALGTGGSAVVYSAYDRELKRGVALKVLRVGRFAEAGTSAEPLLLDEAEKADTSLEFARAYDAAGERRRALAWYERSFVSRAATFTGRMKGDCVEEAVLTLGELGLWKEAAAWTARYRNADAAEAASSRSVALDGYRQWRTGARIEVQPVSDDASPDIVRYWTLEFRLASGARPVDFLPEVEKELPAASETRTLVASPRAELLDRMRETDRAAAAR